MHKKIVGWDVGGAHLKAALLCAGKLQQVIQVPCPLWRGLPELTHAIHSVLQLNIENNTDIAHAITMTGELVDLFANRRDGVLAISAHMQTQLSGEKYFYTGAQTESFSGFVKAGQVQDCWQTIASANWLASAAITAQGLQNTTEFSNGILIDIGSTTTDFIVIKNGHVQCHGFTDAERMQTDELVYTGVVRTPLMSLTQKIMFRNQLTSIAAEYFATTADVYRLTGDLNEADDMAETADGKEKTVLASSRRIARTIGRDVEENALDDWLALAQAFKVKQLTRLSEALEKHLTTLTGNGTPTVILGAGAGHFLAKDLAGQYHLPYRNAAELLQETFGGPGDYLKTSTTFPAAAVACLAYSVIESHSVNRAV